MTEGIRPPGPVPLTVLGGYLGAGKTTLVNRILTAAVSTRVAVIVNDFGSVNIDAELVRAHSADVLELANGCICCDLSGGMGQVIRDLSELEVPPEHVLVEVSGVGDPGPVAAWGDYPGLSRGGALVCADAETVRARARDRWVADTVVTQLRSADLLLLTKTDLVEPELVHDVTAWLRELAPGIPITPTQGLDVVGLLDLPAAQAGASPREPGEHARHRSIMLTGDIVLPRAEVSRRLSRLPAEVVRAKGFVRLCETPDHATLVQVVGRRHALSDAGPWDGSRAGGLVVIAAPADDADEVLAAVAGMWPELSPRS